MGKKQSKIYERMLFTWLVLAGIILFFAPQSLTNSIQFAFVRLFHKPLNICRSIIQPAEAKQQLSANVVDQSKYIKLRNHLANNTQWLYQERQKVETLSGLRDRSVWKGVNFVLADVITACVYGPQSELIINRGRDDGLDKGQFVLGDYSIVGITSDLDSRTTRVRLITDLNFTIAVRIGELNMQRMMRGNGNGSAGIELLPTKQKIKVGDIVYVQKRPGFLEMPIIVGVVDQCKEDDENPLVWDITVKPACDIQKLKSVTVIIMNPEQKNPSENDKQDFEVSNLN